MAPTSCGAVPLCPSLLEPTSSTDGDIVVALDFETADRWSDSACALGLTKLKDGAVVDSLYKVIRPPRSRVCFTEIHGFTWDMLKDEPCFAELWPQFSAFMADARLLVAHNASFDRRVLYGCCEKFRLTPPSAPFVCTVKGARRGLNLPHNRLNDVCAHLGIELEHHNAASDAHAAALIYLHLRSIGLSDADMMLK